MELFLYPFSQYKSIYEVDIRYRDVAQKVESGY